VISQATASGSVVEDHDSLRILESMES
jgi:hypothetical protein